MATIYDFLRSQMLPLNAIDEVTAKNGLVVELGCGQGIIANYLAKSGKRKIIGVDLNEKRLPKAKKNPRFIKSDIRTFKFNGASTVIISDVLHHMNFPDQKKVIENSTHGIKKGGKLIIKEIDSGEFIRSNMSRFWDFIFYPKDKIHYNKSKDLKEYLEKLGYKIKITRPSRLFPGSTTLFVCQKD